MAVSPSVEASGEFGQFAQRVRAIREKMGKTQAEFADMVGVSRSFLSDVENLRSKAGLDLLFGVASLDPGAGRINMDWLLMGEGEMFGSLTAGTFRTPSDHLDHLHMPALRYILAELVPAIEREAGKPLNGKSLKRVTKALHDRYLGAHFNDGDHDRPIDPAGVMRDLVRPLAIMLRDEASAH
jgi:transcriptional regulator with XRE-family HTH domain